MLGLCAAVFAQDRSHLSQDRLVNQARKLIHVNRHDDALQILRPLVVDKDRVDITDIRFLVGISAMTVARRTEQESERNVLLGEAIAAFRAILIDQPQLVRVRLELANAFFLRGSDGLSRQQFELVLAGEPPPAMANNIYRFLRAIRARRKWTGYLSANIEQNDNVNSGIQVDTVNLGAFRFVLNQDSQPRSVTGLSIGTGGEYQYPLDAEGKRRWRFGIDTQRFEYKEKEFDQSYIRLRSGPRWLVSRRSEVSLQGFGSRRWIDTERVSDEYGLMLDSRFQVTQKFGINARTSWQKTHFPQSSTVWQAELDYSLEGFYSFSPLFQGSAGVGYSIVRPKRGDARKTTTDSVQLGLSTILPKGWTLGTNFEWDRRRHRVPAQSLGANNLLVSGGLRLDRARSHRLYFLNRQITFFGFSPQLVVTRDRQRSNSFLHDYQRTRGDLRFIKQF